jgi:futalosine hydrolase
VNVLFIAAVDIERDAIIDAAPSADIVVSGAGPAAAAAATSAALASAQYDLVVSVGIAGGFAPMQLGSVAVASESVFADLGVETADGFVPASTIGFGVDHFPVAPRLSVELTDVTGGHLGTILTVATVTGTAASADELQRRYPDAIAEAMEGAGVAAAASLHRVAFAEVRAISNTVGPRNRADWDIPGALAALGRAAAAIAEGQWTT